MKTLTFGIGIVSVCFLFPYLCYTVQTICNGYKFIWLIILVVESPTSYYDKGLLAKASHSRKKNNRKTENKKDSGNPHHFPSKPTPTITALFPTQALTFISLLVLTS